METLLGAAGRQALYATWVFLLVAPVCAALVRRWPYRAAPLRAALWSLVLLRLILPPDLAVPWSVRAFLDVSAPAIWEESGAPHRLPAVETARVAEVAVPSGLAALPWGFLLVVLLWASGVATAMTLFLRARRRFVDLARRGVEVTGGPVYELAARWRRRFRIRRPVRLVTAEAAVSPFTLGSRRPVIFLPATLLDPRERQPRLVEAAVAHELAHVARWDDLRLLLQRLVQGLWFFHPVAWWAGARLHAERERLCDARVLACGELSPRDYGRSLLTAARINLEGAAPTPAFLSPKERIAMRIQEIVKEGHRRPRTLPALVAVTLLGLFLLPLAPTSGAAVSAGEPEHSADHASAHQAAHAASHASHADHAAGHATGHGAGHGPSHAAGHARGDWELPVTQAKVSSAYGPRVHPMTGEWMHHRGVDLVAPGGTPVQAPAAGRVTVATERYEGGDHHGTVVVIDHGDGLQSFYSHLDSLTVAPGQEVARGQILGTVGSTGEVTGPHLHFEVWRDGEPVDPGELLPGLEGC